MYRELYDRFSLFSIILKERFIVAATEEYLLLLTNRHIYDNGHRKRIVKDSRPIEAEIARMSIIQVGSIVIIL